MLITFGQGVGKTTVKGQRELWNLANPFSFSILLHIFQTHRERESVRTKYVSGTPTQTLRYEMWAYQMAC